MVDLRKGEGVDAGVDGDEEEVGLQLSRAVVSNPSFSMIFTLFLFCL